MTHLSLKTALLAGTVAAFASPALAQQAGEALPDGGAAGAGTIDAPPMPIEGAPAGQDQTPGQQAQPGGAALPDQDTAPTGEAAAPGQPAASAQDTMLGETAPMQQQPGATTAQEGIDPESVRRIQEALSQAGHDAGGADGLWGPQSRGAMMAFQQSQGLEATGLINLRSLEALGLTDLAAQLQGQVGPGQATAAPGMPAEQPGTAAGATAGGIEESMDASQPGTIGEAPAGDAEQIEGGDVGDDVIQ